MTDQTQPEFSAEELAALKLLHDFNSAVRGRVAILRQEMQQKQQAVFEAAHAQVAAMNDEDIDAAVVKELMKQNPPLTEEAARKKIEGADRVQKAAFLAGDQIEAQVKARMEAMTDEEIDAAFVQFLITQNQMSEEEANGVAAEVGNNEKLFYLSGDIADKITKELVDQNTMSDEELDAAVVALLMKQTSEDAAKQGLASVGRDEKVGFLTQQFAAAELENIPRPENPAAAVSAEMGIDVQATNALLRAIVEKHGEEAVRAEMGKIQATAAPSPQV